MMICFSLISWDRKIFSKTDSPVTAVLRLPLCRTISATLLPIFLWMMQLLSICILIKRSDQKAGKNGLARLMEQCSSAMCWCCLIVNFPVLNIHIFQVLFWKQPIGKYGTKKALFWMRFVRIVSVQYSMWTSTWWNTGSTWKGNLRPSHRSFGRFYTIGKHDQQIHHNHSQTGV